MSDRAKSGRHTVLMGDPTYFQVVGGANPHTRDRFGRRKSVDRELAIQQWGRMRRTLEELGVHVHVIPPDPKLPGLVYPANAGVMRGGQFVLSNLTPTRAGEQPVYARELESLGITPQRIESRFEGEADLFPVADHWIFTHGQIERQRFVARLGWPPWRRVYGFRSDPAALREIAARAPAQGETIRIELHDERFYHGDTCLCSFGPGRASLLAYLPALTPASQDTLRKRFGERLVELSEDDAAIYAANSFALEVKGQPTLVMPAGSSGQLRALVAEHETRVIPVDVSEFYKKGGGSVKCMIGDLGVIG